MVKNVFIPGNVAKSSEVNENFEYVEGLAAKGIAQVPYTTLKSTAEWENEGYLGADRFITASGVNGTVNLTETDSLFLNGSYICPTPSYELSSDTTQNVNNVSNPENFFDDDNSTEATKTLTSSSSCSLGKTFNEKFIANIRFSLQASSTNTNNSGSYYDIETFDGTDWNQELRIFIGYSNINQRTFDETIYINKYCEGVRVVYYFNRQFSGTSGTSGFRILQYGFYTNGKIEVETLKIDSEDSSVSIYSDHQNSFDTSIKATISDGTLETDEFELHPNKSTIIPLLSNMQGDMKIKFKLQTTDPTKSPELYGYGVYKN